MYKIMCDKNIDNVSNIANIYDCTNSGTGEFLYAGSNTVGNTTTFDFKSLLAGSGISITSLPSELSIVNSSTISNLPGGTGILSAGLPTATLKSLVAGSNVNLTSDANTITISSIDTGITTLNNLGAGAAVGASIIGTALNLRTITGSFASRVTQLVNTINVESDNYAFLNIGIGQGGVYSSRGGDLSGLVTIFLKTINQGVGIAVTQDTDNIYLNSSLIQPISFAVQGKYLQNTSTDIANSYTSSLAVTSNTFSVVDSLTTLTPTGLTTFDIIPAPRNTQPVIVTSTLTTSDGSQSRGLVKIYPDLSGAWNTENDWLMGVDDNFRIYQINTVTGTTSLMKDYNGNDLPFEAEFIAMDIDDNILFFISPGDTQIRSYDFTNGNIEKLFEFTLIDGWSGSQSFLYFNQENHVLYLGNNFSQVFYIQVRPFNRSMTTIIPTGTMLRLLFTPPNTSTIHAMLFLQNPNDTFFVTYDDGTGSVLAQAECVGGLMNYLLTNNVEGDNNKYAIEIGASGCLYLSSYNSGRLYKFLKGSTIEQSPTSIFGLGVRLYGLTRSPYGITN